MTNLNRVNFVRGYALELGHTAPLSENMAIRWWEWYDREGWVMNMDEHRAMFHQVATEEVIYG